MFLFAPRVISNANLYHRTEIAREAKNDESSLDSQLAYYIRKTTLYRIRKNNGLRKDKLK